MQGKGKVSKGIHTLCPVRALEVYLQKSKPFSKAGVNQLFMSYKQGNLGSPVSKQRIASWLVELIKKAYTYFDMDPPLGVKAHSTRALSTSIACEKGMSMVDICKAAIWVQDSVFAKHYRLDTVSQSTSLTRRVLLRK